MGYKLEDSMRRITEKCLKCGIFHLDLTAALRHYGG